MALSRTHGLSQILEWGRVVRGSSLTHLEKVGEGISEMRRSLDNQMAMRCLLERAYCLTLLAEAVLLKNRCDEALALCDDALRIARQTEGRSYEAETHRVRGEVLLALRDSSMPSPESEFQIALHIARESQCRILELRAAISQYRLERQLGDALGKPAALAAAAGWFNPNVNSPWIAEARRLIGEQRNYS